MVFTSLLKKIEYNNFKNLFGDKNFKVPRVILIVGLLSVVLVASYANYSLNEKDKYRFRILTKEFLNTTYDKISSHLIVLRGLEGIYRNANIITFKHIENYTASLQVMKYFSGSLGIGYIPKITQQKKDSFIKYIREEYKPDFNIYPESNASQYFPVAYLSPAIDANLETAGYNMFSDPRRKEALLKSAASGLPVVSNKVNFSHTSLQSATGFLIFMPIYKFQPDSLQTLNTSLDTVDGFLFSPIIADNFFKSIFKKGYENFIELEVTDNFNGDKELIFSAKSGEKCEKCETIEEKIEVLGNYWTLKFKALPAFYSGSNKFIVFMFCIGQMILVFVISTLSYSQNKAKIKAETANREKEDLLVRERLARGQAEQASRLKEEFLATVSHELRNPLNAVLGWAQIINKPGVSTENIFKGINTIEKNVHIQAKLIDDLLEMSRITSGKLMLEIKDTDFIKVLENSLETVDPALKAKNIKIIRNIETDLPLLKADETRLQQVIWNLLSNAIKFSPENSSIEICIKKEDGRINFSIKDSGAGISADFLPNIFDRFRQENSKITKKHGGLGLGLAISKSLVELHGGEISVQSDGIGKGAEFRFSLPVRATASAQVTNQKVMSSLELHGKKDISNMNILVIDDESDTREMLKVMISQQGANVECASSVDEALNKVDKLNYDLIISDIGMPEKDGYEFARSVRSHKDQDVRVTPIIALSAYARENDRNLARDAGFSAHLSKPLNVTELFQLISNLV